MEPSKESIAKFKEIYKREYDKELNDQEAYESASNLLNFFELMYEIDRKDHIKKRRLKNEPDGFPVHGNYSCILCHASIDETTGWYDWYGQKCLSCQKAVNDKIVPTFIFGNRESYITTFQLKNELNIKTPTLKKLIRDGTLHPRTILNENGSVREYIFLKKENPNLVEHFDRTWKSIKKHRDKVHKKWATEEVEKIKSELKKTSS